MGSLNKQKPDDVLLQKKFDFDSTADEKHETSQMTPNIEKMIDKKSSGNKN